jgi:hypothetical protein
MTWWGSGEVWGAIYRQRTARRGIGAAVNGWWQWEFMVPVSAREEEAVSWGVMEMVPISVREGCNRRAARRLLGAPSRCRSAGGGDR